MNESTIDAVPTESDEIEFLPGQDETSEAPFVPILKVWREVLGSAAKVAEEKISPQWASRICSMYTEVHFGDMPAYHDRYFAKVEELRQLLLDRIGEDDECLNVTTPAEDNEHNAQRYRDLLGDWQVQILQWELDWDCTAKTAAAEFAAMSEVHKLFFEPGHGLVNHLDSIKLEVTDADQQALADRLNETKEGR